MEEEALKNIASQLRKPEGDEGIQIGRKMNESNEQMNRFTLELLTINDGDTILEIGMGNGLFVKDIVGKGSQIFYHGCDYSELMINEAIAINKEWIEKNQVRFTHSHANSLPFKNGTFSKLFTVNTIYFWENPKAILKEFKRVLKPNGKLIIALRPKQQMEHYPFTKYGFRMFSKDDMESFLRVNGLEVFELIEKAEPDFTFNDITYKMESLIAVITV